MTLSATLLQKLNSWQPVGEGRHILAAMDEASGWTAVVTADRADQTGCLLWELTLQRKAPAGGELRAWSERASTRVTGLLEPLKVVEVDTARGEALLRSREPSRRGEQLFYYEVLLKAVGGASVRRFQASHELGQQRQQLAFALTHEHLAKLADDLTAEN